MPIEHERPHRRVLAVAHNGNAGVLASIANFNEIDLALLLVEHCEALRDLLIVVVEEAFVLALAEEELGEHQPLILQINQILLLLPHSGVNHGVHIIIEEQLLQQELVGLRLVVAFERVPTLFVDEVLGLLPVTFDLPLAFEDDV